MDAYCLSGTFSIFYHHHKFDCDFSFHCDTLERERWDNLTLLVVPVRYTIAGNLIISMSPTLSDFGLIRIELLRF